MLCAITAVARKLAVILHRLWIDGTEFNYGAGAVVTRAMRATLKAQRAV
jgi:hypothetical protein